VGEWRPHSNPEAMVMYGCKARWEDQDLPEAQLPPSGLRYRMCYGFRNTRPESRKDAHAPDETNCPVMRSKRTKERRQRS
jgi:hypothetical protein